MTTQEIQEALDKKLTVFYGSAKCQVINENGKLQVLDYQTQRRSQVTNPDKVIIYDRNSSLLYNWFINRFGFPTQQKDYFAKWEHLYEKGITNFLADMDTYSFAVFMRVLPIQKEFGL